MEGKRGVLMMRGKILKMFKISIIKTMILNLYYFPLKTAIKIPIICAKGVKIQNLGSKNAITLGEIGLGKIRIGLSNGSYSLGKNQRGLWSIKKKGSIIFHGSCYVAAGAIISVGENGTIEFGHNFTANANLLISCGYKIVFGRNCLLGWNNTIIDDDGHKIYTSDNDDSAINKAKEITIGQNVWIAANATILKGVKVSDNSIIAINACVSRKFNKTNVIIGGNPGHILKENIKWEN